MYGSGGRSWREEEDDAGAIGGGETGWGTSFDASWRGPMNVWGGKKAQWDPEEIDLEKKLLDSPHYNPIINLETMTLTQIRVMLAYTYILAAGALIYTRFAEVDVDNSIHLFVLNPVLAVAYLIFFLWFIKNCCCDCYGLWRGKTRRVREQFWIMLTLFLCALCAGEFALKSMEEIAGLKDQISQKRDRISKYVAGAVLTSALKLLWLLLMDSFGHIAIHDCGFYFWKLLFAISNATLESTLRIKGYNAYGQPMMMTTWIFYGVWCIWLIVLMIRTAYRLEEFSYIQTRMRQLGFRFFCFQTTVIMLSIMGCLGISAYRKEPIVCGYQMVAHGYMLLLGWCYIPLPASESIGRLRTLETEVCEVFESLQMRQSSFEVSKMCLLLSWEVYRIPMDFETNPFKLNEGPLAESKLSPDTLGSPPPLPSNMSPASRYRVQQLKLSENWRKIGGWSLPPNTRPKILHLMESEEHIRCMVAEMSTPPALVISFRGTANIRNMVTDCSAWRVAPDDFGMMSTRDVLRDRGVYIHSGFWSAYMSIRAQVLWAIAEYINPKIVDLKRVQSDAKDVPIILTGHSLGGALACLAALDIGTLDEHFAGSRHRFTVGCITFGQPRVGNRAFARLVDEKIPAFHRIVYERDIVTGQPSIPLLFKHAGTEAVVDDKGNCIPQPTFVEKTFMGSRTDFASHKLQKYVDAYNSNIALINKLYSKG